MAAALNLTYGKRPRNERNSQATSDSLGGNHASKRLTRDVWWGGADDAFVVTPTKPREESAEAQEEGRSSHATIVTDLLPKPSVHAAESRPPADSPCEGDTEALGHGAPTAEARSSSGSIAHSSSST